MAFPTLLKPPPGILPEQIASFPEKPASAGGKPSEGGPGDWGMTKVEIKMSNDAVQLFVIRLSSFLGHLNFVIRHSALPL
jgi:hypothetical protein